MSMEGMAIVTLCSPFIAGLLVLGVIKIYDKYSHERYWRRRDEKLNRSYEARWRLNGYDD